MNKIVNFLIVKRPEIENKWWHRLANVLILGSSIMVLILMLSFTFSDFKTNEHRLKPSGFTPATNVLSQNSQLIKPTSLTLEKIQQAYKATGLTITAELLDGTYVINSIPASRADVIRYIGSESQKEKEHQKVINRQELLKGISLSILNSVAWFIFWESIFYRTIIYIIFGKNSKTQG